jgi:hypothetical protein
MNESDIKQFVIDTVRTTKRRARDNVVTENTTEPMNGRKQRMQFSKKIMIFACLIYAATWGVTMYSWLVEGIYSTDLKEMATWLFGACVAFYNAKSLLEHKFDADNKRAQIIHDHNNMHFGGDDFANH